ncbi:MAG: hypothetical protein V1754_10730 [Pseudomonadota bacterium]
MRCEHCSSGLAVGKDQLVRLKCPRCSGNFYYLDGAMCGLCPYCDAVLFALTRDRLLRYVILPASPCPSAEAKLWFVPFWRMSALLYGWNIGVRDETEVEMDDFGSQTTETGEVAPGVIRRETGPVKVFWGRVIDRHLPDPSSLSLGVSSLRLRGIVHPMEPFAEKHEELGRVLPAALKMEAAREYLISAVFDLGNETEGLSRLECQRADLVAETISLLYYPFWVRQKGARFEVWDAVNGEPEPLRNPIPMPEEIQPPFFDELKIVELVCGKCKEPLVMGNRGVVFPCTNCSSFWVVSPSGLQPFAAQYAKPQLPVEPDERLLWLPFWQLIVEVSYGGKLANKVQDIRNVLGILGPPGELPTAPPGAPLSYFVPAYGALRSPKPDFAARDMIRLQPRLEAGPGMTGQIFNCFLGPEDAERMAYAVWLQILPGIVPRKIRSLRIKTGKAALWYLPFREKGRELINLMTGLRYDRAVFRGVEH